MLVNLHDYLDTGLFLDHRPLRTWLGREASGGHFLNLFSYTGVATSCGSGWRDYQHQCRQLCHLSRLVQRQSGAQWLIGPPAPRRPCRCQRLAVKGNRTYDLIMVDPRLFQLQG